MTTESDFQQLLDADPTDWQTRLIFADWLQERNDIRAAGYRALGRLRLYPRVVVVDCACWLNDMPANNKRHVIPHAWASRLTVFFMYWDSRQDAEDAAAKAFALLDPTEQAALCPS